MFLIACDDWGILLERIAKRKKHLEEVNPDAFLICKEIGKNWLTNLYDDYRMVIDVICRDEGLDVENMRLWRSDL